MTDTPFIKMHGLGNDFVVFDGRQSPLRLSEGDVRRIADRHTGVGCDQLIAIETAPTNDAGAYMRIWNADGGEVEACGNAVRCVGALLMDESGDNSIIIDTKAGLVATERQADGRISADMGRPETKWAGIPIATKADTLHLDMSEGALADPVGVGMGNPHAVFFVGDVDAVNLAELGPKLEIHPLYPNRTNVEIAEIRSRTSVRVRVWERGAGITRACGTGACAVLVAAHLRGLAERKATIELDGGALDIEWMENDHVLMTGPVATVFRGSLDGLLKL
ncbi:MAG: diaminopimelate epimerase [Rhodospirillales bacterium]|nr:diaminopimelate epimerase [Rhodospirillales bacterium]